MLQQSSSLIVFVFIAVQQHIFNDYVDIVNFVFVCSYEERLLGIFYVNASWAFSIRISMEGLYLDVLLSSYEDFDHFQLRLN